MALENHEHNYKRMKPLKNHEHDPCGTYYIGGGSWGIINTREPKIDLALPEFGNFIKAFAYNNA